MPSHPPSRAGETADRGGAAQRPKLADVAKAAGVSTMTASRALRGTCRCAAETRKRVQEIAERLGYRPDPLLSIYQAHVRSRKTPAFRATLAWLNDDRQKHRRGTQPWEAEFWKGAQAQAAALGYKLEEIRMAPDIASPEERVRHYERILQARGIPGVIIPGLYDSRIVGVTWTRTAVVCLGTNTRRLRHHVGDVAPERERYDYVQPDYFSNMTLACERLKARGHRRIALHLPGYIDRGSNGEYAGAYLRAQAAWPEADRLPICPIDLPDDYAPYRKPLRDWLECWKPDAILTSYRMLRPLLEDCGWRVPRKISLVHLWLAQDVAGWCGIDPLCRPMGAAAVEMLAGQFLRNHRGAPEHARSIRFTGLWCDGETETAGHTRPGA